MWQRWVDRGRRLLAVWCSCSLLVVQSVGFAATPKGERAESYHNFVMDFHSPMLQGNFEQENEEAHRVLRVEQSPSFQIENESDKKKAFKSAAHFVEKTLEANPRAKFHFLVYAPNGSLETIKAGYGEQALPDAVSELAHRVKELAPEKIDELDEEDLKSNTASGLLWKKIADSYRSTQMSLWVGAFGQEIKNYRERFQSWWSEKTGTQNIGAWITNKVGFGQDQPAKKKMKALQTVFWTFVGLRVAGQMGLQNFSLGEQYNTYFMALNVDPLVQTTKIGLTALALGLTSGLVMATLKPMYSWMDGQVHLAQKLLEKGRVLKGSVLHRLAQAIDANGLELFIKKLLDGEWRLQERIESYSRTDAVKTAMKIIEAFPTEFQPMLYRILLNKATFKVQDQMEVNGLMQKLRDARGGLSRLVGFLGRMHDYVDDKGIEYLNVSLKGVERGSAEWLTKVWRFVATEVAFFVSGSYLPKTAAGLPYDPAHPELEHSVMEDIAPDIVNESFRSVLTQGGADLVIFALIGRMLSRGDNHMWNGIKLMSFIMLNSFFSVTLATANIVAAGSENPALDATFQFSAMAGLTAIMGSILFYSKKNRKARVEEKAYSAEDLFDSFKKALTVKSCDYNFLPTPRFTI